MILRENGTRFYVEGKVLTIGGRISANGESEYEGLFGTVTEIRSGADRETENDVPDIYCDFETPVAEETLRELEERFSGLYGEAKTIDDISLDCVIMSPDMLEPLDTPPGKREDIPVELSHFGRRMKFLQDATYRRTLKSKKTASPGCGLYPPRSASFWSLLARLIT